jgi:hypothetical protein
MGILLHYEKSMSMDQIASQVGEHAGRRIEAAGGGRRETGLDFARLRPGRSRP